ncbi:MAG: LCP family protein [Actinomycetales bacterium]|nr:LCP family protein [Actinomycetales bacterium]
MTSVPRRWPRILAAVVAAAVVVAAIVGGGLTLFMGKLAGNITAVDVSEQLGTSAAPSAPVVVDEETGSYEPFTVLLMGSDSRSGKGNKGYGSASEIGGERSDTTILVHVNADRSRAVAVSIPRDTLITLPKCKHDGKTVGGYTGKFNEAFDLAGPGCTMKAVQEITGLDLQHFMMVDFGGFKRVVNAVGGVEICLAQDVNDPKSGLNLSKGKHVVTGEEALAFVRARKTLGDGSDTSRIRRQQAFISSLARQVLSAGTLLNPAALVSILTAASESLSADPALANVTNLKDLALSMKDLRPSDITFVTMPWKPAGDGANVLVNEKKAQALWDAIANDTPYPPKKAEGTPLLKTEPSGIYVNVLNGTGVKGAAKKVAKKLRKAGYRVMDVGNVEDGQVYDKTTVIYDPKWDVSSRTLVYAANAVAQPEKKHGQRMDLIIGTDFTDLRDVEIDELASDVYANMNTADETFCAS